MLAFEMGYYEIFYEPRRVVFQYKIESQFCVHGPHNKEIYHYGNWCYLENPSVKV